MGASVRPSRTRATPGGVTYNARLYALVHNGTPGDVEFYQRWAEGSSRILELGSGWGRITLHLAEKGYEVVGLEKDESMLAEARRRAQDLHPDACARARFVPGDMVDFDLDGLFDRIFVPFSGIYCLLRAQALARCLASVRAHLSPEGLLVFDAYGADTFHADARPDDYPEDQLELVAEVIHEGEPLTVYERSRWNREAQRIDATYVYQRLDGTVRYEAEIGHRYLLSHQVAPALEGAGLKLLGMYSDFDGTPHEPDADLLVVVAARTSAR